MLDHRTNVLLNKQQFNYLNALAEEKKVSIGHLIRDAVNKTYGFEEDNPRLKQFQELQAIKKKMKKQHLNEQTIKSLITEGRRY